VVPFPRKGFFWGEVAEWFNAAGFKKLVTPVVLASEVRILPSPQQLSVSSVAFRGLPLCFWDDILSAVP
jgi:hypothetical protein